MALSMNRSGYSFLQTLRQHLLILDDISTHTADRLPCISTLKHRVLPVSWLLDLKTTSVKDLQIAE